MALGAFGLVVAGDMVMRSLGIGPAGSLIAAGVLPYGEPLIVAEFHVAGPDSALGSVAADAVRTSLGRSRAVTVVSVGRTGDAVKRRQLSPGSGLDATLALSLARREGVGAVVGGGLTPHGAGYRVTLCLVAVKSGDELASFQATAKRPTDLIPTLDKLTRSVRSRIGESLVAVRADPPLDRVTIVRSPRTGSTPRLCAR